MITLVPVGGLCNRMRAISAALSLAHAFGDDLLHIQWFRDRGLRSRFSSLFDPIPCPNVRMHEAAFPKRLLYDSPRWGNLFLPRLFQSLLFDATLGKEVSWNPAYDYRSWRQQHPDCLIASYGEFYPKWKPLDELFVPTAPIKARVQTLANAFSTPVVGVHIRRTDHVLSKQKSSIEAFIREIDKFLNDRGGQIYLASDSIAEKQILRKRYGNRLLTLDAPVKRDNEAGMTDAVVDLYTLAETERIIGSYASSFSELAAQLKGKPLIIAKDDD